MYCEETLTLNKLMEIVSQYHNKEALTLAPESQVNHVAPDSRQGRKCWRCNKVGLYAKEFLRSCDHKCGKYVDFIHFEQCCKTKQNKEHMQNHNSGQSHGGSRGKPKHGRGEGNPQSQCNVRQINEETMDPNHANSDDFYVFSAGNSEGQNTIEMLIEDKPVNVVIDSGENCNLMSEEVSKSIIGGITILLVCKKRVYTCASVEPLKLRGKYNLAVQVPQTSKSLGVEFYITCNKAATLRGCETSELLGMLRVGVPINSCEVKHEALGDTVNQLQRKAALKKKFPKVFEGLGKLKGYQLKLHIDESVQAVAQLAHCIPFSRRAKVNEKLDELLKLDMIEKVEGPTSWKNLMET